MMIDVILNKEDLNRCEELALIRKKFDDPSWSGEEYTRGLCNSDRFPYKTELMGAIGEIALSNFLGLEVDWNYYKRGDSGSDFTVDLNNKFYDKFKKEKILIGCKEVIYPCFNKGKIFSFKKDDILVYARHSKKNGKVLKVKVDFEFFCHADKIRKINTASEYKSLEKINVKILGYLTRSQIEKNKKKNTSFAIRGDHKNYYDKIDNLKDPLNFKKFIELNNKTRIEEKVC